MPNAGLGCRDVLPDPEPRTEVSAPVPLWGSVASGLMGSFVSALPEQ